jgi:hypothetical protein
VRKFADETAKEQEAISRGTKEYSIRERSESMTTTAKDIHVKAPGRVATQIRNDETRYVIAALRHVAMLRLCASHWFDEAGSVLIFRRIRDRSVW